MFLPGAVAGTESRRAAGSTQHLCGIRACPQPGGQRSDAGGFRPLPREVRPYRHAHANG